MASQSENAFTQAPHTYASTLGATHTDRQTTWKLNASGPICWTGECIKMQLSSSSWTKSSQEMDERNTYNSGAHCHPQTHTYSTALCPGLPGWAGTRKVKPIGILLKQETVSGTGISWAICKSASRSRQMTMLAPHHSVFYRPVALPANQPTVSKHWRHGAHSPQKTEKLTSNRIETYETIVVKLAYDSAFIHEKNTAANLCNNG